MFENILGHEQQRSQLRRAIEGGTLPSTLLFTGPKYAGKLTTALELARSLTCEGDASWSCPCRACAQQRALLHPETLLVGRRDFLPEIHLARRALLRAPQRATLYLFLRSVRKLTRRFDSILWEGEDQRIAKTATVLNELEELLREIDVPDPAPRRIGEAGERVVELAESALRAAPADLTPISLVRNVAFWARIAPTGRARVVVIENAENLNDAARNAMLKILEEPPPSVYFVLIAERGQAVIDTIRSRARLYSFADRGGETEGEVIRRIFRDPDVDSPTLREYFLQQAGGEDSATIAGLAGQVAAVLRSRPGWERYSSLQELSERVETSLGKSGYRAFFEALLEALDPGAGEASAAEGVLSRRRVAAALAEATQRSESLNMSMQNVLEDLMYTLEHNAQVH